MMPRSYRDVSAERKARRSADAVHQGEVFAGAYKFAVSLIALRESRGLTQEQLAAQTGIDQGDISRIERGSANPTEKTLIRIADALGAELKLVNRVTA
jgi:ribosome-binding protein aMBF1 (putative translation factor)